MLDFLVVSTRSTKRGTIEIYPKFIIRKSSDLMIRGSDFYAIWDEEKKLWSTNEEDALYLIDRELDAFVEKYKSDFTDHVQVLHMWDADSGSIDRWHKYCQKQSRDSYHSLDEKLIFANTNVTKKDYSSKSLPYALEECDISAYTELSTTLYNPEELHKIEWAIGSIVTGDSKKIQKFMVLYGAAGTGKSTMLNIIQELFEGYYSVFDAKALGSANNSFALESFHTNPLVAIQHDGDLSRIEDNTRLNSLVSHEQMTVNEKFKSTYSNTFNSFLFMGTNKPVKITDAKSGIIRRLIDVKPSGNKIRPISHYRELMKKIEFELGGIACHCRDVYLEDPNYYDDYEPKSMMASTNDLYNFILENYNQFYKDDRVTLTQAWEMYKTYCEQSRVAFPLSKRVFIEEIQNYFREYLEVLETEDGTTIYKVFSGFMSNKFEISKSKKPKKKKSESENSPGLVLEKTVSLLDEEYKDCLAQYATVYETPKTAWAQTKTTLKDISTMKLHYVKPPENHIVIDFDLKDENGNKSKELNLIEAAKWKPTYAEFSKGGSGVHLHYIYTGDVSKLSAVFDDNIEVKKFTGGASLRRKLSYCNDIPIATISSGLPLKEDIKTVNYTSIKNEKAIRTLIKRNLNKEYMAGTKPSIDFIFKILNDAYESGIHYDVTDLRPAVSSFAAGSSHHASYCIGRVNEMQFKSAEVSESAKYEDDDPNDIVFFDVEVFPNLFVIVWKKPGKDCIKMINPTPDDVEELIKHKLIGFNNRRYDNHILYARLLGYTNEQLFNLSCKIINSSENVGFAEAKNISYTDIYDFSSKKQSLKKFEIELGIHHQECGLPWDQPAPEDQWEMVADYCCNDVIATEAVFNARQADYTARLILADLAGMTPNDSTNSLTTKIIFGSERHPALVYTDLATGKKM